MLLKRPFRSAAFIVAVFFALANRSQAANEVPVGLGPLTIGGGATSVGVNTGYFQGLSEWLQVGGNVSYQVLNAKGVSNRHLTVLLGPQFNLIFSYPEALTLYAALAWRRVKTDGVPTQSADDASGLGFAVMLGKRFPVAGDLILHPCLGVLSAGTFSFAIIPARVSLNF